MATKPSKLGRKGDPRMHKAVAERLANPDLTLLEALRKGGFNFPHEGGHDATLTDSDGVTLGQRKNQLSRRLRLARQSIEGGNNNNNNNHGNKSKNNSYSTSGANGRKSGVKRSVSILSVSVSGDEAEDSHHNAHTQHNHHHEEEVVDMGQDDLSKMAKYHPNYHPLFPAVRPTTEAPAASSQPYSSTTASAASSGGSGSRSSTAALAAVAAQRQSLLSGNPSGVAVATLISTANSVGMTLEQLAMSLSSTPNLLRALSTQPNQEAKLQLALNLYRTDCRALLQRCMLLAGYEGSEVTEGCPAYMDVALKAWEVEGKRLEYLLGCHSEPPEKLVAVATSTTATNNGFCDCLPGVSAALRSSKAHHEQQQQQHHDQDVQHHYDMKPQSRVVLEDEGDHGGRHVHRLAGKCGHKAIIHQPHGRPAHIDFVVDGRVECYEGIKPIGPKGQGALWPSRYRCIELACPKDPNQQKLACGSENCDNNTDEVLPLPKELPLSEVDFDGKEWNVDFFNHTGRDDTLMGLIKLGESDAPVPAPTEAVNTAEEAAETAAGPTPATSATTTTTMEKAN